ncbi:MAG: hypothetical protein ACK4RZ_03170 [Paracoccaceae bacterium]
MTEETDKTPGNTGHLRASQVRDARLKAALKANMARRKAQAKVRGGGKKSADVDTGAESDQGTDAGKE